MKKYGFNGEAENNGKDTLCRIVSQEKGYYKVASKNGEKLAEVSGKFRFNVKSPVDFPSVGDFVYADWNKNGYAVIKSILPRKSCFVRKGAGDSNQPQVIASNIDYVFIIILIL